MANGHPDAMFYPVGMVWEEAEIVVERINRAVVTESVLLQLAVGSLLSKDSAKEFKKATKRLLDGN